jgi:hypothetical protein
MSAKWYNPDPEWRENPEWDNTPTNPGFFNLQNLKFLPKMEPEPNPIIYALYLSDSEPIYVREDGTKEIIPEKDRII